MKSTYTSTYIYIFNTPIYNLPSQSAELDATISNDNFR